MAQKITKDQIEQMLTLYEQIGTYSGVAKQMGVCATTVSRYVKEAKSVVEELVDLPHESAAKPIEEIDFNSLLTFSTLTKEEQASYNAWLKEFGR
jgi:predicted transcriptional regulator